MRPPGEYASFEEWASLRLYDAAESLRMSASGASDPLPEPTIQIIRATLEKRVAEWRPGRSKQSAADEALRAFIVAALDETREG